MMTNTSVKQWFFFLIHPRLKAHYYNKSVPQGMINAILFNDMICYYNVYG